jgi:hypothetical protein
VLSDSSNRFSLLVSDQVDEYGSWPDNQYIPGMETW